MILAIVTFHRGQKRNFKLYSPTLEAGLDALSRIATGGDPLLSVELLDNQLTIQLPIEAFDGRPMSGVIQQLKQQWQAVLRREARSMTGKGHWFQEWRKKQVDTRQRSRS